MTQNHKRGFTLIELLVVIAIIAVLASIMFPVFAKAKEKASQSTCISNLKQLATASAMYVQDNKRYPEGATWVTDLGGYVNNNKKMFSCPTDPNADGYVSYNYNGCLNGADGKGITSESVLNASETGLCIDGVSKKYPEGKTINGGTFEGRVDARHDSGYTIAFVDGHASYTPKKTAKTDGSDASGAYGRAFFFPPAFGWINNPGAGIIPPSGATVDSSMFNYGGSSTVEPIILSAVKGWIQKGGYEASFTGIEGSGYCAEPGTDLGASSNSTSPAIAGSITANWGAVPFDYWSDPAIKCVASDALGIIVSAASKLPITKINSTQAQSYFSGTLPAGVTTLNVYERTSDSGTYAFFHKWVTAGTSGTAKIINVASTAEMIAKVGADPFGIGYASLGDVDPNLCTILDLDCAARAAVASPVIAAVPACVQTYSRAAVAKGAGVGGWIFQRPLFAKANNANVAAAGILSYMTDKATFQKSLPFQTSFFAPKAAATDYLSSTKTW
jgi:prepilin-type N-terminal cleavage/methylation domain-containing protein/prepilin-type processing-associated H-X9-DG protein